MSKAAVASGFRFMSMPSSLFVELLCFTPPSDILLRYLAIHSGRCVDDINTISTRYPTTVTNVVDALISQLARIETENQVTGP